MEMHQIRSFLAVAEDLNFTHAAERCNVAQPSISRAIKMLEVELGGSLFHRERTNTHLSELGRIMKPYLEMVYKEADNAKSRAAEFTKLKKVPLRLGLMCTIASNYLLDFIKAVLNRHPDISLQIADASAMQLETSLLSGEREVAIYAMPSKPKDDRLYYMRLYEVLGLAFMPRLCVRHPEVDCRPLSPAYSREVALLTVRGRPRSPAVGALVMEAMRCNWVGEPALAVRHMSNNRQDGPGSGDFLSVGDS